MIPELLFLLIGLLLVLPSPWFWLGIACVPVSLLFVACLWAQLACDAVKQWRERHD